MNNCKLLKRFKSFPLKDLQINVSAAAEIQERGARFRRFRPTAPRDITPITHQARSLVIIEQLIGVFFRRRSISAAWSADDPRRRGCRQHSLDRVVPGMRIPGRARSRRISKTIWRGDKRSRPARLLLLRRPRGRHDADRAKRGSDGD
jgi:hypothetical protein